MAEKGCANFSEAFRDWLRGELRTDALEEGAVGQCVETRASTTTMSGNLRDASCAMQHDHQAVTVSTMPAHLDHDERVETVILRGPTRDVMRSRKRSSPKGVRQQCGTGSCVGRP